MARKKSEDLENLNGALEGAEAVAVLDAPIDEAKPRKRGKAAAEEAVKDGKLKLTPARRAAIDKALGDLTKKFGEGTIMRLGDANHMAVEAIPTGALSLDIALGIGGVPRGRVIEIYGPEASGKTTLCLHIVAEAQKKGGVCGYVDMEHALDPIYAAKLGVDVDNLYISQPDTGEQALEIAEALVRSGAIDVVVVDSVAALVPRAEIEGDMGDATMGQQARLMSQALRKLTGAIKQTNTAMIFTNQLRQKIGVMFGNPETTTGGNALKFYASVRLDVRRIQALKDGGEVIGNRTRVRVTKNKVAPPFREAEFDILYNEGISTEGDVLDLAESMEIVTKRGAFYSYNDTRIGQGREQAKQYLRDHPEMMTEIDVAVRAAHAANTTPAPAAQPGEEGEGEDLELD
ncbi:MAG: recombinase RecA [Anaerolineales bacterium]|nr:recombinase RecA [Anaerolineales bacterium]